jgi:hypothetical protein
MGSTSSYAFSSLDSKFRVKKGTKFADWVDNFGDDFLENAWLASGAPNPIDWENIDLRTAAPRQ